MYRIIILRTLNLHKVSCQLHLSKAGGGGRAGNADAVACQKVKENKIFPSIVSDNPNKNQLYTGCLLILKHPLETGTLTAHNVTELVLSLFPSCNWYYHYFLHAESYPGGILWTSVWSCSLAVRGKAFHSNASAPSAHASHRALSVLTLNHHLWSASAFTT